VIFKNILFLWGKIYIWNTSKNILTMEAKNNLRPVKLRAFSITNDDIKKPDSGLLRLLEKKLQGSVAQNRRMLLNKEDPKKEEDLISDYTTQESIFIHGVVLRICPSEEIPNIPDTYLQKEKITISDLDNVDTGSKIMYKDHFHFSLNNDHLVTNLPGNKTITRLQTYINWLLEKERGAKLFEFTPMLVTPPNAKLSELKNIAVKDSLIYKDTSTEPTKSNFGQTVLSVSNEILSKLIKDVTTIEQIKEKHIISAQLLIKFSKPRKMSDEDYGKIMGAYLKPISETDNISFTTRNGNKITGTDILRVKSVEIEETSSGKISENQLSQEMEKFLQELKNENSN